MTLRSRIEAAIRTVDDFPLKGFPFRDVTPLLEDDAALFREIIDALAEPFAKDPPDCIVCIESFGYVFGAPVAYLLGSRVVLARRAGKLPRPAHREEYAMIYSHDRAMELHEGALRPDDRAVIVDDVLASGGSALAAVRMIEASGARCVGLAVVADLPGLPARLEIERRGIAITSLASVLPS